MTFAFGPSLDIAMIAVLGQTIGKFVKCVSGAKKRHKIND